MQNCKNCGTQLRDGARFCPVCGSPAEQPGQAAPNAVCGNPMLQKVNQKTLGIIAGIVGLIVVAVVLIVSLSGRNHDNSYKTAVETYLKACETRDFELLLKAYPPDFREDIRDTLLGTGWFARDEEEFWDAYYAQFEYYCGPHVKMSYKLGKAEQFDEDELENREWLLEFNYNYECDISAGYEVEVNITYRGEDDTYEVTSTITVVKIQGKWYVYEF